VKSRPQRVVQRLLGACTVTFGTSVRLLPFPLARQIGRLAGRLAYYVVPKIRRVGLANVARALGPDLAETRGRQLVRAASESVGMVAAEFAFIPRLRSARFLAKYVHVTGLENLPEGPCVLMGAHLGNWEWMAPVLHQHGLNVGEVVRPLDDSQLDGFIDATRRSGGIDTIPKVGAGREILRRLKRGQKIGILVDQSPRDSGVPVDFFGAPCWATVAPAMAAVLANVPIHPVSLVREQDGRYTLTCLPALPLFRGENKRQDLLINTQRCQKAIEDLIRAHPEQWLWFHRRWKKRPKLEQQWQQRHPDGSEEAFRPPVFKHTLN
jgi:KDO2-lipid IV(A) lauroyltransferase